MDGSLADLIEQSYTVGAIIDMDYRTCTVLTNDSWKEDAGGLPKHCFLLARPEFDYGPDAQNVVFLLRVTGPAELPDAETRRDTKQAVGQDLITSLKQDKSIDDILDDYTRTTVQFSAVEADIIGSFYDDDGITFAEDIDTYYSAAGYSVHKPADDALEWIASYADDPSANRFRLGDIQYSTIDRGDAVSAPVHVNVEDFAKGHKTAVLGMTRTGKSNTIKVIAAEIAASNADVGQLIFDPSGEYSYRNTQDNDVCLATIDAACVGGYDTDEADFTLEYNFFKETNIEQVHSLLSDRLAHVESDYIEQLLEVDVTARDRFDETDFEKTGEYHSTTTRNGQRIAALHGLFVEADLNPPSDYSLPPVPIKDSVQDEYADEYGPLPTKNGGVEFTPVNVRRFWKFVADELEDENEVIEEWLEDRNDLKDILRVFTTGSGPGKLRAAGIKRFHSPESETPVEDEIYQKLTDGQTVIIDLANGRQDVIDKLTEQIVDAVLSRSQDEFRAGETPENIVVYLEEAHRRFDADTYRDESMDPYVELAKEGAKFNISMVYATQEVSSIDDRVLANTKNWVITHLNNGNEVNELAQYYEFDQFSESIQRVTEPGYARFTSLEMKYIVPVLVKEFDTQLVKKLNTHSA